MTRTERENKYTAVYFDSMTKHLSRPFLVPRSKFLGAEDSREMSHLAWPRVSDDRWYMGFSHSTGVVVSAASDEISIESVRAQKEMSSFRVPSVGEGCEISSLAISANGELIASEHDGCTVLQWDAVSGEPVGVRVEAHSEWVSCLVISKDGSKIVSGSKGKTLCLCNAKNSEPKAYQCIMKMRCIAWHFAKVSR